MPDGATHRLEIRNTVLEGSAVPLAVEKAGRSDGNVMAVDAAVGEASTRPPPRPVPPVEGLERSDHPVVAPTAAEMKKMPSKSVYKRIVTAMKPYKDTWKGVVGAITQKTSSTSAVTLDEMSELTEATQSLRVSGKPCRKTAVRKDLKTTVEDVAEDGTEGIFGYDDSEQGRDPMQEWDPALTNEVRYPRKEAHLPSVKMNYFRVCQESNAQVYLDRRERPPAGLEQCPKCRSALASKPEAQRTLYRCVDCHQVNETCVDCIKAAHEERPFDRIWTWNIALGFWEKKTMGDLGFVWNIGHEGGLCVTNHSPARAMVFLHEHGVMDMRVKFCECLTAESEAEQLIRHGCWPATWKSPHTAITLATMAVFHGLELQGQLNVHDYIRFLRRMTDGVEPDSVKDRYREFNNSMREYRQVRARRRHGVPPGAIPSHGELAVLCPACPQPDMNMRPGWQDREREYRYMDSLCYSIDGNFHLGSKAKNTDEHDVALSEGAGYFVNTKDFATYLEKLPEPPVEPSTCNQFGAMGQGKYKGKVSGLVAITCRHMFLLPGGIVDLLLGEKYRYADFALVSCLQRYLVLLLLMGTYDIHCQYIINLRKRLNEQFGVVLSELDSIVSTELPEIVAAV
ncbi:hypothetical protein TRAPUB_2484 [Trametes pubescens]|uniref:CxC2-like cysteine cluster KDZ transposase-associated domain-containing protein n=1 Tax=Trametes pubescens TaxID=154538 RepID=A0A1M2V4X6_TRAPU|nr:hypothetical protein TRAPUB_6791 [Trametes pubescens]OJT06662.1 hypothetical protein TRAPUB_2484 [Trametes pubescens]